MKIRMSWSMILLFCLAAGAGCSHFPLGGDDDEDPADDAGSPDDGGGDDGGTPPDDGGTPPEDDGGGGDDDGGPTTCPDVPCPEGQTCIDGTCVCDGDGEDGGDGMCKGGKTLLCHFPPGHPSHPHEICVGTPAVPAHEAHGDTLGPCP